MLVNERKIIVCCPHVVTGGPELLHQLVHELRSIGRDAYIAYYPFDQKFSCPEPYRKYDVPQGELVDDENTFILLPEVVTAFARKIKKARVGIWWLSVDYYFPVTHQSKLRDFYSRYMSLIRGRLPLRKMRGLMHFTQSAYAAFFLEQEGIQSVPLSDYLSQDHLGNVYNGDGSDKADIIVFNPKKGQRQTNDLIARYPALHFVPIENMTPRQVSTLLHSAKIYVDFGHHPGKDRPPREAAIAGCCVITSCKGSAKFYKDLPIPEKYKLDDGCATGLDDFRSLVSSIFSDFNKHTIDFAPYREKILQEPEIFKFQVKDIFGC